MPVIPSLESLGVNVTKEDVDAGLAAGLTVFEVNERAIDAALDAYGVPRAGRSVKITMNDDREVEIEIRLPEGWRIGE